MTETVQDTEVAQEAGKGWFSADTATFGDRLAGARESIGLSQKEVANRLGVRQKTLVAWENDLSEPRSNKLQMLAGLLGVSLMWLLTGEGEGIESPDERRTDADASAMLSEMRALRTEIGKASERLGRLEKRLRLVLAERAP
ncbi:helix-turn-helix domain-containing protein [Ostreiculturibacter nitratireducens]|uniref:helix-turn-helix domain-containing protein n=1 Tax=Ostreiculturibacter nitratireducens TaxID=3075226 RepID=UPI0031B5797C